MVFGPSNTAGRPSPLSSSATCLGHMWSNTWEKEKGGMENSCSQNADAALFETMKGEHLKCSPIKRLMILSMYERSKPVCMYYHG